eukprot:3796515-Amphidinium_carterae.1
MEQVLALSLLASLREALSPIAQRQEHFLLSSLEQNESVNMRPVARLAASYRKDELLFKLAR